MVTVEQASIYIGVGESEPLLPAFLNAAETMCSEYLGTGSRRCPEAIRDQAVLQLTSELWQRRNAPSGIAQWGPDGQAIRLSKDAMIAVKPLLNSYRPLGSVG